MGIGIKSNGNSASQGYEFVNEFYPKNIKRTIHLITQQLKQESSLNIDYLFLPFRKEQTNEALLRFLNTIMPKGDGKPLENENKLIKIIKKTSPGVLFQSLKYIWSRTIIPTATTTTSNNNKNKTKWVGIVGYDAYLKFKEIEIEKMFPKKSFLEIMPRCLTSPDHASLVYDMFDLISTISSNAPKNKMSCRKISKMCAIWAFDCSKESTINDNDNSNNDGENESNVDSFVKGIERWVPKADAMFHLSLAFIRSFAPEEENIDKNDFPVALLHVLKDNAYPPEQGVANNMLQVPVITLHRHYKQENFRSNLKPWSLINNINNLFKLDDFTILENDSNQNDPINKNKKLKLSRQQKALIKSVFSDKSSIETISKKMSKQSKKIMKEFTTRHSSFQAGWVVNTDDQSLENNEYDFLTWTTCFIDDFYIWTWMSSLSNEEAPNQRNIFGRSLILEFEFDAFKKWVVFEESGKTFHQRAPQHKNVAERISSSPVNVTNTNNNNNNHHEQSKKIITQEAISNNNKTVVSKQVVKEKEPAIITGSNNKSVKEQEEEESFVANETSFVDHTNASSTYNNKTIINGYMTNGDITQQSEQIAANGTFDKGSYQLPLVNVDMSAFNIDLPDIDPSQITINGESKNIPKVLANNDSKDSITDAIKGLDDELLQVEKQIHSNGVDSKQQPLDPFLASNGSTVRSLQFNNSQQQLQNQQPPARKQPSPAIMQPPALQVSHSGSSVPERSPERRKQYSADSLVNSQTSQPPQQQQYQQQQYQQPPPQQQQYQQPLQQQQPVQQYQQPVQKQQTYQQPPVQQPPVQQQPVQQYQQKPPQQAYKQPPPQQESYQQQGPPALLPATSSTLYEQPRFNNNSSSQITNSSTSMTSGSTPVSSDSNLPVHAKKPSVMVQTKMAPPQHKPVPMQVPQQVLQQKPKLPRAFTMQNLAQQQQQLPAPYHKKQPSLVTPNSNPMPVNSNGQRAQFHSKQQSLSNNIPQQPLPPVQQMQPPTQMGRNPLQQPTMSRNGRMPRSQSYNQLPQSQAQKFMTPAPSQATRFGQPLSQPVMAQPRATMTMVSQQNPYLRQQTMSAGFANLAPPQQQHIDGGQGGFMPQQFPSVGNRYGGGGMVMPTSHKGKRQEKKNLQQQLRNGAFGM